MGTTLTVTIHAELPAALPDALIGQILDRWARQLQKELQQAANAAPVPQRSRRWDNDASRN